ncbi:ABC transporter permease [Pseudochryseolinea flava]|uniref:ABC transporter permease n=1 Tax=Pseudochryseolinea flava TaxID=2059302 RepID=A0A364Y1A8_9BACT|nr:ABC transporter permease [Pseudochryseolinea flava]RAV99553.1 ABC transporter permease [Pseudochryseolinea flava]
MNVIENLREGLRSVQANLLRSIITALIVTIGITALISVLTAVDAAQKSVSDGLSALGSNTFDIRSKENRGSRQQGVTEKTYARLKLSEMSRFMNQFNVTSTISLSANLTQIAEVKYLSKKTNPNVSAFGVNEGYLGIKNLTIEAGRNFSSMEIESGKPVVIIGHAVFKNLYSGSKDLALNTKISVSGVQMKVIGVLQEKGESFEDNFDNMIYIPIKLANQMAHGNALDYTITVSIQDASQLEHAMGEATGIMRAIRRDEAGRENSFELESSEALKERTAEIAGYFQAGGFGIGFVTLLGAAIALMNIMLVSVTERTREIGVRKALGATPSLIRQQFIIEAIVVCLLGGLAGIILGIIVGNLFGGVLGSKAFFVPWVWVIFGFVVCIIVGLMSGWYPAQKASRLDPIESLRFE